MGDVRVDILNVKNAAQCHTCRSAIVLSFLLCRHQRQSTGFGADIIESFRFERDLFDLISSGVDQGTDYLLYPFQFWNLGPECYTRPVPSFGGIEDGDSLTIGELSSRCSLLNQAQPNVIAMSNMPHEIDDWLSKLHL